MKKNLAFREVSAFVATHGNEMIPIFYRNWLLENPDQFQELQKIAGVPVEMAVTNPEALEHGVRGMEQDINRVFSELDPNSSVYEIRRASELDKKYGGRPLNFVVDMHTTESDMGFNFIVTAGTNYEPMILSFCRKIALDLGCPTNILRMPDPDMKYMMNRFTIGKGNCLGFEYGPMEHGKSDEEAVQLFHKAFKSLLTCVNLYNTGQDICGVDVEEFDQAGAVNIPKGCRYHPDFIEHNYKPLCDNTKLFIDAEGNDITFAQFRNMEEWPDILDGRVTYYPGFINEGSYSHNANYANGWHPDDELAFLVLVKHEVAG